ncbi:extracellular solute-binding protein [Curtobacterium flaccumfaciens]|nr:extracellular solute-binding protein [Curtobacterium flaccumfaciens]
METPMQRRRTAGLAAAAAAVLVLTGCSAGSNASDGQSKDSLTWAMWIAGKEDKAAWQKVADTVKTDDDVDVSIQGSPFNDYWTKLRTQLSTGTAPCIVSIQSLRAANYTDVLVPIDDMAKQADLDLSEYDQTGLDGMKVDGKLYGLPYDTGPMVMFYNKDIFDKAGVPEPKPGWTVDEFEDAAKQLKAAGTPIWGTSVEDIPLESMILGYNGGRVIRGRRHARRLEHEVRRGARLDRQPGQRRLRHAGEHGRLHRRQRVRVR